MESNACQLLQGEKQIAKIGQVPLEILRAMREMVPDAPHRLLRRSEATWMPSLAVTG